MCVGRSIPEALENRKSDFEFKRFQETDEYKAILKKLEMAGMEVK